MPDFFHVDAFTAVPFAGNPAAVYVLERERSDSWLQRMAAEMNLSETAFVRPESGGGEPSHAAEVASDLSGGPPSPWSIRWFTPALEVDLCGHATLASAHALWQSERVAAGRPIVFSSRSGALTAGRTGDWIELDFPSREQEPCDPPAGLIESLGVMPLSVGRSQEDDLLVEVADSETLRGIDPDQSLLGAIDVRGVIVTCRGDDGEHDFLSRFFAPASGVPEDPVTGSAHCCLGPFWGGRLGKKQLLAFQASQRGGVVRIRLEGERVKLGGQAVTVAHGTLEI